MFSKLKFALALALTAVGASHCVREVIIDLPEEEPKTVAVSHFTEGRPFQVEVTISQPLYAGGVAVVPEDAHVTISRDGQLLDILQASYDDGDRLFWLSRESPLPGQEYTLSVRVPGKPDIEAHSYVPVHAGLAAIAVSPSDISSEPLEDGRNLLRIPLVLEIKNMPETDQFFAFGLHSETVVYENENGHLKWNHSYQSKAFFLADGRTLSLLHNIPEPVVLIDEKFWNDNRRTIFLDALVPFDPETPDNMVEIPLRLFVEWRTLSEDFYRYHLSLARQGNNLPLSDPDAVFNNVTGGYGNFSGYSVSVDTVQISF